MLMDGLIKTGAPSNNGRRSFNRSSIIRANTTKNNPRASPLSRRPDIPKRRGATDSVPWMPASARNAR